MSDDADPFAALAQEQMTSIAKSRLRQAKTREEKRQAKAQDDKLVLHQQWQAWHRKEIAKLQASKYRKALHDVDRFLEDMTISDGGKLIALIERGPWRRADEDTRYLVLGLVAGRIMFLRTNEGWPPFDDSLPGEELATFDIIRKMLT